MSHLRLVAGTLVSIPEQLNLDKPTKKESRKPSRSPESRAAMEDAARRTIQEYVVEGNRTVSSLFAEMNHIRLNGSMDNVDECLARNAAIREKLRTIGIWTAQADGELDLDVQLYGSVAYSKTLIKIIPDLKRCEAVLPGLTF